MLRQLLYFFVLISLGGCTLFDSDSPNPAYLIVNSVDVETIEGQGAPTHNLTDVWVYADNELIGVFELPARIPIILKGETTDFEVFPGFRNNGEKSRSFIYQLMGSKTFTETLSPGDEIEKSFTYTYGPNAKFDFVEDFEGNHIFTLELDEDEDTRIETTSEEAKSGQKSGKIYLTQENPYISAGTIFSYPGENNGNSDSYLEMDYKCDVPFFVGVIYTLNTQVVTQPFLLVSEKEDWHKLYVDFTPALTNPDIESYRIFFTTDVEPLDSENGTIYLDNLKFVHF